LPANGEVAIFLTWDDAFGASSNNYDLYLVQQSTGRVVASSTDIQSGRQDPAEAIDYVNRGAQDLFRIVVQNVRDAAQPKHLNIFSIQPECAAAGPQLLAPPRHERHNYNTATRSVSAQGDAGGPPVAVIAVGAVCSGPAGARSTVRDLILGRAIPLSGSSPDNVSGFGRADAFASLKATRPAWRGSTTVLTVDGNTTFGASLTAAQLGFVDANRCPLTALNWTGGCGTAPGSTITCPVGSSTISVSASNNGLSFSDAADLQIVVTVFAVDVSPSRR